MPKIEPKPITPFWQTTDQAAVRLYLGNVTDVLARLPERSVHCTVTSPPYHGLRDYKTPPVPWPAVTFKPMHDLPAVTVPAGEACYGSEPTPLEFVAHTVLIFRSLRRVLRDDGVCWLNFGDSYASGEVGRKDNGRLEADQDRWRQGMAGQAPRSERKGPKSALPSGNLVGVPWRVALALQADGWVLRQDVIWHKPSPMPESVRNRCTKAHEYVFLLAKGPGYFYDAEAIKEKVKSPLQSMSWDERVAAPAATGDLDQGVRRNHGNGVSHDLGGTDGKSNKRSVWSVSSQGYEGAHFATFPPKLITPMVLAGTSAHGCCADCGAPWRRVTAETKLRRERPNDYVKRTGEEGTGNSCSNSVAGVAVETVGWEPTCTCHGRFVKRKVTVEGKTVQEQAAEHGGRPFRSKGYINDNMKDNNFGRDHEDYSMTPDLDTKGGERTVEEYVSDLPLEDHPVVPCTVLDPFIGSGTSCCVALEHGRRSVGIDLSETYLRDNAIPRIEGQLLSTPETAPLAGKPVKKVMVGRPAVGRKSLK